MFANSVFRFWNMVASVAVFFALPAELSVVSIFWLLLSSLAGVYQVHNQIKA